MSTEINALRFYRCTIVGLLALIVIVIASVGQSAVAVDAAPSDSPAGFENDAGWTWHLIPVEADFGVMANRGVVIRLDELRSEDTLVTLAYSSGKFSDAVEIRPVAFDAAHRRYVLDSASGASTDNISMYSFVVKKDVLRRSDLSYLGVEVLTLEKQRDVVAPAAFMKLKDSGCQALPFPITGKPYEFELTMVDGKKFSSKDFRGKVVLLDFWATWCAPCMKKLPELKETYKELHSRGFEVIGINHDFSVEKGKDAIERHALPWPNAMAPEDRDLWDKSVGCTALPYLLLIDRDGIMRGPVQMHNLRSQIQELVDKSPDARKP